MEFGTPLGCARAVICRIVHGLAVRPGCLMSGRLPAWLAELLGVPVPSNADTATWQLDSHWSWAPWATLLLVLFAITWTVSLYARESGSAGRMYRAVLITLRLAAIGLV